MEFDNDNLVTVMSISGALLPDYNDWIIRVCDESIAVYNELGEC